MTEMANTRINKPTNSISPKPTSQQEAFEALLAQFSPSDIKKMLLERETRQARDSIAATVEELEKISEDLEKEADAYLTARNSLRDAGADISDLESRALTAAAVWRSFAGRIGIKRREQDEDPCPYKDDILEVLQKAGRPMDAPEIAAAITKERGETLTSADLGMPTLAHANVVRLTGQGRGSKYMLP